MMLNTNYNNKNKVSHLEVNLEDVNKNRLLDFKKSMNKTIQD